MQDPTDMDKLRSVAGLPPLKYTTYYNLGGPDKNHAVGRVNGEDKFVVEMEKLDYNEVLEKCRDQREAYLALVKIYNSPTPPETEAENDAGEE